MFTSYTPQTKSCGMTLTSVHTQSFTHWPPTVCSYIYCFTQSFTHWPLTVCSYIYCTVATDMILLEYTQISTFELLLVFCKVSSSRSWPSHKLTVIRTFYMCLIITRMSRLAINVNLCFQLISFSQGASQCPVWPSTSMF